VQACRGSSSRRFSPRSSAASEARSCGRHAACVTPAAFLASVALDALARELKNVPARRSSIFCWPGSGSCQRPAARQSPSRSAARPASETRPSVSPRSFLPIRYIKIHVGFGRESEARNPNSPPPTHRAGLCWAALSARTFGGSAIRPSEGGARDQPQYSVGPSPSRCCQIGPPRAMRVMSGAAWPDKLREPQNSVR
jgi:hypothetical protein